MLFLNQYNHLRKNSLKSAKKRDKDCRLIRRKGKLIVINKKNPRLKARQG